MKLKNFPFNSVLFIKCSLFLALMEQMPVDLTLFAEISLCWRRCGFFKLDSKSFTCIKLVNMKVELHVSAPLVSTSKGKCDVLVSFYCHSSLKWGNTLHVLSWQVRLHQNYRSTRSIVEAATSLIQHNKKRCQEKQAHTLNDVGEKVFCHNPWPRVCHVANQLKLDI